MIAYNWVRRIKKTYIDKFVISFKAKFGLMENFKLTLTSYSQQGRIILFIVNLLF